MCAEEDFKLYFYETKGHLSQGTIHKALVHMDFNTNDINIIRHTLH